MTIQYWEPMITQYWEYRDIPKTPKVLKSTQMATSRPQRSADIIFSAAYVKLCEQTEGPPLKAR